MRHKQSVQLSRKMSNLFFAKVHKIENEVILAVCDSELSGTRFRHNGVTIRVTEYFYGSEDYYESEIISMFTSATQINAMGERVTNLLIREGIVHPDSVLWMEHPKIGKVGHVISMGVSE